MPLEELTFAELDLDTESDEDELLDTLDEEEDDDDELVVELLLLLLVVVVVVVLAVFLLLPQAQPTYRSHPRRKRP